MSWTSFLRPRRTAPESGPLDFKIRRAAAQRPDPVNPLPRFKTMANDTESIARGASSAAETARTKLQRAFTPSQPVGDLRMFAGRRDLLLSLIRAIEEKQMHAVVFGDRGIGKTSLLHVFSMLAREARYIVRYFSCSEDSTFDATFRAACRDIPLLYHNDVDPTSDAVHRGASLSDILPEGELTVSTVSETFEKLSGTRVLLVIDEFDRAKSVEFRRSIAELIKSLSDRSIRVQIVIAGVAGNLTELVEHIPSIRRNVVGIPVAPMNDDEVLELLHNGEEQCGLAFEPRATDRIVEAAIGSPYVAGLLGQQSASLAIDRSSPVVESIDVAGAIKLALEDIRIRIPLLGQQQIQILAASFAPLSLGRVAEHALKNFGFVEVEMVDSESAHAIVHQAVELGVLEHTQLGSRAGYRFADDSLAFYFWLAAR